MCRVSVRFSRVLEFLLFVLLTKTIHNRAPWCRRAPPPLCSVWIQESPDSFCSVQIRSNQVTSVETTWNKIITTDSNGTETCDRPLLAGGQTPNISSTSPRGRMVSGWFRCRCSFTRRSKRRFKSLSSTAVQPLMPAHFLFSLAADRFDFSWIQLELNLVQNIVFALLTPFRWTFFKTVRMPISGDRARAQWFVLIKSTHYLCMWGQVVLKQTDRLSGCNTTTLGLSAASSIINKTERK